MTRLDRLVASGVPDDEAVAAVLPSAERLAKGPVAVIECFQEIPCDPCAAACPRGAILPFGDIKDLPSIDHELCNGCANCVVKCPGLAIFVIDVSSGGDRVIIKMPYEYLPLPRRDQEVWGLDRSGKRVAKVKVLRVQRPAAFDRTALLTIEVPASEVHNVRGIAPPAGGDDR